jgi:translation initiation factor IF-2
MRIYDLAKSIGQTFRIEVKSSTLADEFKTLPEFEAIRDTIKSHSSSVDDKYARLMHDVYARRQNVPPASPGDKPAPAPLVVTPPAAAPAAAEAPRVQVVLPRPAVSRPAPPRPQPPLGAGTPPRPAPIRPNIPRPIAPIAASLRPEPIKPMAPATARHAEPGKGADDPARQAPAAMAPRKPSASPEGKPPSASHADVRPVLPKAQKPRPSGLATELRSSTGTTGVTADPQAGRLATGAAGQPNAPAMPKFSSESIFLRTLRGEKPRPPRDRRPGEEHRPRGGADENRARPGGAVPLTGPLPLPEIGVMRLKPKRHRPAPATTDKPDKPGRRGAKSGKELDEAAAKKATAKKGIRPSKVYSDPEQFRRAPSKPTKPKKTHVRARTEDLPTLVTGPVIVTGPLTTAELAGKMGLAPAELIKRAFMKGKAITINQLIDLDFAEDLAIEMDIDLRIQLEGDETDLAKFRQEPDNAEDYVTRPPVVTIMGHVDHGKTSVLDYFRKSRIAEGEFGGITQHIGAYKVQTPHGTIIFLDTPGHEAFTSMRARGVQCTDIAVLVVAADDGVMPQTVESINHARAAEAPMIVAINKMDLPQANADRVRQELMQHSVLAASLGGDVEFVEISAKKGTNMEALLEVIILQAQLLDLKSNPKRRAEAIVIESNVDPQRGAMATVLVQQGTLKVGDLFVVGAQSGRVRSMVDDLGQTVKEAKLAMPVELIGLSGTPEVGEVLLQMDDEREAREIAERRGFRRRLLELGTTRHVTLEGLHDQITQGEIKELNVILRADVQGSIEAIEQAFDKLSADAIRVRVLHSGTGQITESDVSLAMASNAVIIGFNIRPEPGAADLAQREQVEIKSYRIIYELLDEIERAMLGMVERKFQEHAQARVEIRQVFKVSRFGNVAGCMVISGDLNRGAKARLVRDGKVVYEGSIGSLRRLKDDVAKVAAGYECGVALERFDDYKPGDVIETYVMEEMPAELVRTGQN